MIYAAQCLRNLVDPCWCYRRWAAKMMALGALLAALERDLPVAYLEAIGYTFNIPPQTELPPPFFVHIWLEGEVLSQTPTRTQEQLEVRNMSTAKQRPTIFWHGITRA